ncbi:MAG: hypothetical protein DHS20C18_23720 [Saprospiraceae bacterium]|nr:MAG: hypothetical protein DHS20C18_23720 [Saprospiraceae bacterium]
MNKPFSVTARAWKDVPLEKGVFIHSLTDLINEQIKLSDYGTGVAEYNFTAIIEPDEFFPTKYRYLKSKKRIDAEIRMGYEQALNATQDDFKGLVTRLYLDTIDLLEKENIQDFDLKRFRQDLEDLFERMGWVVSV